MGPLRPSIVGLIPITGYSPINLLSAIKRFLLNYNLHTGNYFSILEVIQHSTGKLPRI